MNAEKTDQGRSCKPFKFDLALSVLSAFICVLLLCAVCPAQIHPHSFSPRQLGIMQAWYRADAITALADGDPVASWVDSTANARTLAQSTANYRPAYKVSIQNGRPAIRFDGSNDCLTGAAQGSATFTIFSVQRLASFLATAAVYASAVEYMNWVLSAWSSTVMYAHFFGSGGWFSMAGGSDFLIPGVWTSRVDGVNGGSWVNGVLTSLVPQNGNVPNSSSLIYVGCWSANFRIWNGDIFELAFFAEALSDRDRQRVERYLLRKWGL